MPDDVVAVEAIPHTITGKKLEVPVKRILQSAALEHVVDPGSIDAPTALRQFSEYRAERSRRSDHVGDPGDRRQRPPSTPHTATCLSQATLLRLSKSSNPFSV
ncbi:hypothetical protein SGFS_064110 [Streptomyces graminofaciens]|uniref:AMP-binding enzyme C-terminal domain-containing protein n=1 Tax=Streptomyces graminofaciens TaxID=68212 RepID=A0ABN5VSR0_9ACTN|nr:hypothetical protein SGFS_064110 [Streptomyces graminofaciens]